MALPSCHGLHFRRTGESAALLSEPAIDLLDVLTCLPVPTFGPSPFLASGGTIIRPLAFTASFDRTPGHKKTALTVVARGEKYKR